MASHNSPDGAGSETSYQYVLSPEAHRTSCAVERFEIYAKLAWHDKTIQVFFLLSHSRRHEAGQNQGVMNLAELTQIRSKSDFQDLAEFRLREATALLQNELWDGSYYLAGYAVELGLKACIIKMLMNTDAFPDKDFSRDCYTHSLVKLVELAGIDNERKQYAESNTLFEENWIVVKDWSEKKRYERIDRSDAEAFLRAVSDEQNGVLPWIKTHW